VKADDRLHQPRSSSVTTCDPSNLIPRSDGKSTTGIASSPNCASIIECISVFLSLFDDWVEHQRLHKEPYDSAGHEAHRQMLKQHIDRLRVNRRRPRRIGVAGTARCTSVATMDGGNRVAQAADPTVDDRPCQAARLHRPQ
jgi:hypothetical protein